MSSGVAFDDLIGAVLPGTFRLDAVIARGELGVIYRANQLILERGAAAKVMHATLGPSSPSGQLFVQQIWTVARIDHPNVVRIHHEGVTEDGRLFVAMELVIGRDLEQLVNAEGPLAVARAVELTRQVLAGLGAAHAVGLVHADVKPSHVIVGARGDGERVVLIDFGLARPRASHPATRAFGGTPAYMAPEQLLTGQVDARSDVFSTALVLVTLLTGWRRRAFDELVPPLDGIADPALRAVVRQAVALDPEERFQTAAAFADALAVIAQTLSAATAAAAARRRRRCRWWMAALVLAALAGGALRYLTRDRLLIGARAVGR